MSATSPEASPEDTLAQRLSPEQRLVVAASWLPAGEHREEQRRRLARLAGGGLDWAAVIALVDRHRTPALAYAALRQEGAVPLPEEARQALQQRDRAARLQAMQHTGKTVDLLRRLAAQGVEAIPLKGVFLSQRLYGDIGVRQSKDIDLLVRPEDFDAADALLGSLGYGREPVVPGHWPTARQEAHLRRTHYHYEYDHVDGTQVELHWRRQSCAPRQMGMLWEHSAVETWMGARVRCLDDDMLLLFLCDHGAHHRWFRLKWLSDVAMLFAARGADGDAALLRLAAGLDLERPLAQAALLVAQLYGVPVSPGLRAYIAGDAAIEPLARDAVDAIAGSEADGLMRVSIWRKVCFQSRLRKRLPWSEMLLRTIISPYDFALLPLPDRCFWAYALLRAPLFLLRAFKIF